MMVEYLSAKNEFGSWKLYFYYNQVRSYARDDYVNNICGHRFSAKELEERYLGARVSHSLGLNRTDIPYVVRK